MLQARSISDGISASFCFCHPDASDAEWDPEGIPSEIPQVGTPWGIP